MMSESGRCIQDFWLQFAGGLSHFGVGSSVEASADESPSVHHLGEVHSLKEKAAVTRLFLLPCLASTARNKP